jgi:predicted  nucleic acid-binding Zn-ribbon protein
MTIKLQNFTSTIDVESVEIEKVNDNVSNKIASVDIIINGKYSINLQGFEYSTYWEDSEVLEWANNELIKYQIK